MTRTRALEPSQAEAAHTLDRHISVTAGPGAGKTTVLVERYLHILRTCDVAVDQIVAITFTNRAANEMRERLRGELDSILRAAPPDERRRWMRHKRTLDGAVITTIHGFCARLLREFPVEAGVDPQFALLDQYQSAMLEEAVVEEVLTSFIDAGDEMVTKLAAGVGRSRLAEGLIDVFRSIRNQGLALDEVVARTAESHSKLDEYNRALEEASARISEFISMKGLAPGAERKRQEAERRWPRLREMLSRPESVSLAEFCQMVEEFSDEARPNATGKIGPLVRELDGLLWGKKLAGQVPLRWLDTFACDYATRLMAVLGRIGERLREEKQKLSALDFDDLQALTLKLLEERPEVLSRAANRYRFFLMDEVQDTNTIQRDLTKKLALGASRQANLFIVGDPKQSIYGFRGADVDVFRELTEALEARGGASIPLNLNFRSQPPLIDFFNLLFSRVFKPTDVSPEELNELGFVQHESSEAKRESLDELPLVEILLDLRAEGESDETPRERDARQLTRRINQLVEGDSGRRYELRDIALLFKAMTEAWVYEAALRRTGIPYVTVQGKGFYEREEISDLVQLLRFLDNKTDELALAAVLRSPLCGVSDNGLLALRCAPAKSGRDQGSLRRRDGVRRLVAALDRFEEIDDIPPDDLPPISRARTWLSELVERRQRYGLSELLRWAVESSEFRTVIASTFDGAQRLANVEKLLVLAERFEQSGAHMIRDFVRFIRDFAAAGGRESEGRIDDSADAVRLMSIHQAKGLEFPVVILPELHRQPDVRTEWHLLDRHRGLTVKVPDGRGWRVAGHTMLDFRRRAKLRDQFESMRSLYVGATRARDRLIMSGAGAPNDLGGKRGTWLIWIAQALGLDSTVSSAVMNIEGSSVRVDVNLIDQPAPEPLASATVKAQSREIELVGDLAKLFPLLNPIEGQRRGVIHRFSVTQLINYGRCPRQYYFDRVIHAPTGEEMAIWNDAEAPEPPSNLTATLRGAVIHRFCESYSEGEPTDCLRGSLDYVLRLREAELGDRVATMDRERAVSDIEPLALNYLNSSLRERVESTREASAGREGLGVLSELRFRLRRPLGILTGTIDKLLVREKAAGLTVEIVDFKTSRFRSAGRRSDPPGKPQMSFSFLAASRDEDLFLAAEADSLARDYELQMQSYALAAYDLIPGASDIAVTLHFLHPGLEKRLTRELLDRDACASAIDNAMSAILSSRSPESFEVRPAQHCRVCSFREVCVAGRNWLAETD